VSEFVLTQAERVFLRALDAAGVRYLLVGMGAALIEGAPGTTQDLDLWIGSIDGEKISAAANRAGGFFTSGFGLQPPAVGGKGLDRVDLVLNASGLDPFGVEYARSREYEIDGLLIRILPLERIIVNKRAANRPKDVAQLPMLEASLAARTDSRGDIPLPPMSDIQKRESPSR
jgi:hypothetical protein